MARRHRQHARRARYPSHQRANSSSRFPVLSVTRGQLAAFRRAGRRLLWMNIRRAMLWRVFFEPFDIGRAARETSRHDVAKERLRFHDGHVRLAGNRHEIVGGVSAHRAGRSKMKWDRDLVGSFSIQLQWPDAATDQSARFDPTTETNDTNVIAILDPKLRRKLGRQLDKHLRLQLRKMTEEATHAPGGMMFGQAISR